MLFLPVINSSSFRNLISESERTFKGKQKMRHTFDGQFLERNGKLAGVALGADFCAEHECGIKELKRNFGVNIDSSLKGLEARKTTICPFNLIFNKTRTEAILILVDQFDFDWQINKNNQTIEDVANLYKKNGELVIYRGSGNKFSAAWDSRSFGILVKTKSNIEKLEKIFEEFKKNNVVVNIPYSGSPFKNNGLTFVFLDAFTKEEKDQWLEYDLSKIKLDKFVEDTNIVERLKKAGKYYFALSPKWENEKENNVIFWLNPMEQSKNNYGWVTLQDLENWINDTGKISINHSSSRRENVLFIGNKS